MHAALKDIAHNTLLVHCNAPNLFITEHSELLQPLETILCVGVSESETPIFLADKGLCVEALDMFDASLIDLRKKAREHYLYIKARHTLLAYWEPSNSYGAVVCSYFHVPKYEQKMLFEKCFAALKEGGIFMAEFFSESQVTFHSGGPSHIGLLYDFNDISAILKTLPCHLLKLSQEVISLKEGGKHHERASVIRVIARKVTSAH